MIRKIISMALIFYFPFFVSIPIAAAQPKDLIEVAPKAQVYDGIVVKGPKVLWKSVINGKLSAGITGPVIVGKGAFYISLQGKPDDLRNGYLCAVNSKNGALKWVRNVGGVFEAPLLKEETLYVGSFDGNMYAFQAETGKKKWTKETENWQDSGMRVSPIHDDKKIYFGYDEGILYALNKKSGKEIWRVEAGGTIFGIPLLRGESIYFASSAGKIYSVDAQKGTVKWEIPIKPDIFFLNLLYEEGKIGFIWCENPPNERKKRNAINFSIFDAETGELKWAKTLETSETLSWPVKAFIKIFLTDGNELFGLNFRDGEKVWNFKGDNVFYPALLIHDRFIIAAHGEPFRYEEKGPSKVFMFDCESGEKRWEYTMDGGADNLVLLGGNLLCGNSHVKSETGEERSSIFFIDVNTGEEKGKVLIKEGETVVQRAPGGKGTFYLTTRDAIGNSYIYKLRLEI